MVNQIKILLYIIKVLSLALTSCLLKVPLIFKLLSHCKNDLLKRSNAMELPGKLATFYFH